MFYFNNSDNFGLDRSERFEICSSHIYQSQILNVQTIQIQLSPDIKSKALHPLQNGVSSHSCEPIGTNPVTVVDTAT